MSLITVRRPCASLAVGRKAGCGRTPISIWVWSARRSRLSGSLGGRSIALRSAPRIPRFYVGEQGAQVWKDWALPAVGSVAEEAGLTADPIEGVWLDQLNYLAPRAYTFTPYWGEAADPAVRKVLETAILVPDADIHATLTQAAQEAQDQLELAQ